MVAEGFQAWAQASAECETDVREDGALILRDQPYTTTIYHKGSGTALEDL